MCVCVRACIHMRLLYVCVYVCVCVFVCMHVCVCICIMVESVPTVRIVSWPLSGHLTSYLMLRQVQNFMNYKITVVLIDGFKLGIGS